ncbi:hypothetical protein FPE01S_01_14920 [Flavihumibacter petaseus NBRC 106054]|uniref:Uncharacterized protein n=2 Tax=Flavihumibacter TaxID=1004301 RepID=A0A0E9MYA1_9BACT|nr:hypothetical protein FPE01S_01_14920 [Flavihumibacter petaseus NBRC 106054]
MEWLILGILFIVIGWLSYMTRQHYALTLQDRLVRNEMRLRYYILTGKDFSPVEHQLSMRQLAALRFAGDEEFPDLTDRAIKEKLSAGSIKQSIRNWKPDYLRV